MLAANAAFEFRSLAASALYAVFYEFAHSLGIYGLEWIGIYNFIAQIVTHEGAHIVAAETEGHLGEVVGTEAEELGAASHTI